MTDIHVIKAENRVKGSKGAARRDRLEGKIPAIIYGMKKDPESITLSGYDLMMAMQKGGFFTNAQTIEINGKTQQVLPRDIQREPVFDKIQHVDFMRYDAKRQLKVMVAVHVTGEDKSNGVKQGGVVSLSHNEVELLCRADSIPNFIEVDISELEVGDSAHMSSVTLPEGVTSTADRDITLVSILTTRTSTMAALDDEAEGGEEGTESEEGTEEENSEESSEK